MAHQQSFREVVPGWELYQLEVEGKPPSGTLVFEGDEYFDLEEWLGRLWVSRSGLGGPWYHPLEGGWSEEGIRAAIEAAASRLADVYRRRVEELEEFRGEHQPFRGRWSGDELSWTLLGEEPWTFAVPKGWGLLGPDELLAEGKKILLRAERTPQGIQAAIEAAASRLADVYRRRLKKLRGE